MISTCKSKKLTALAAVLLSLLMLLSLSAVSVFAETTTDADEVTTADPEAATTAEPESDDGETNDESEADTATETGTGAVTGATTTAVTEKDTSAEAAEKKEKRTRGFINLAVGAVILIALAILGIKFRSKIPGWWKALKSECGKISWCSKDKLKKNTLVVVIIIVAIVIAIGVLDFVFSRSLMLLGDLFK